MNTTYEAEMEPGSPIFTIENADIFPENDNRVGQKIHELRSSIAAVEGPGCLIYRAFEIGLPARDWVPGLLHDLGKPVGFLTFVGTGEIAGPEAAAFLPWRFADAPTRTEESKDAWDIVVVGRSDQMPAWEEKLFDLHPTAKVQRVAASFLPSVAKGAAA